MSLFKYQVFLNTVKFGNFTKAAEHLGLTQSAVSHAIHSLEKEFGFQLLNRSRSGIRLTHEGKLLMPAIRQVLQDNEKIDQEASAILGLTKGSLSVGIFASVSKHLLPDVIQMMDEKYPHVRIKLKEGNYEEIEEQIIEGELDCGFITRSVSKHLQLFPLKKDRILCIVSPNSPLYQQSVVSFSQIENEPFIMPAYGGYHEVKQILNEHDVHPIIRFELMDESVILAMITHHLGISILPELTLPKNIAPLKALPLESDSYRTVQLATRLDPSPVVSRFVEIVKNCRWRAEN